MGCSPSAWDVCQKSSAAALLQDSIVSLFSSCPLMLPPGWIKIIRWAFQRDDTIPSISLSLLFFAVADLLPCFGNGENMQKVTFSSYLCHIPAWKHNLCLALSCVDQKGCVVVKSTILKCHQPIEYIPTNHGGLLSEVLTRADPI